MKIRATEIAGVLIVGTALFVGQRPALAADSPAAPPATQPLSPEMDALIQQLGADDFHIREKASAKLEAMGKDAIPALKEAKKSPDPEIHTRAEAILSRIDQPAALPLPQPTGSGNQSVSTTVINGQKII